MLFRSRTDAEWDAGHIADALHVELNGIEHATDRIPRERELVVVCKGGYRSSIGASLLRRAGFERVSDLAGGMDAWDASAAKKA